jgi:succinate dehydrogenase / fumarate reductase membrane anchor subunit
MALYSTVGRPRPHGSRLELAIWVFMRLTGLMLFVLAISHFLIVHVLFDPSQQTADWIATHRWTEGLAKWTDGTMLVAVIFHAFAGVRTVVQDYVGGRARTVLVALLVVVAVALAVMGVSAIVAAQGPIP